MVQPIEVLREKAIQEYPAQYQKIIHEWNQEGDDAFWLMYSANYLFRWAGVRWVMDPITLNARIPSVLPVHTAHDFDKLEFIILTHRHADHFDLQLLKELSELNIPWIVPDFLLDELKQKVHIPSKRIIIPYAGEKIEISGIKILPLNGSHWEYSEKVKPENHSDILSVRGVPAFSYQFESGKKRWFFPGDTRTYNSAEIALLDQLDGLVAHVWLGRASALVNPPPLLEQFCRYLCTFRTNRIILAHLYEWGRNELDIWNEEHAKMIIRNVLQTTPEAQVSIARTGQRILI